MSTRVTKFQTIYDKQVAKYGKCLTIVMGDYNGRQAAFLLQNMFPITEYYLDHIHTRNGNAVPVNYTIQQTVRRNIKQLKQLISKGYKLVFPDINRLEQLMLLEVDSEIVNDLSLENRLVIAQQEADKQNLIHHNNIEKEIQR